MTNKIIKIIEFCYGHRLVNHKGKCRNFHGHNAILEIDIESEELDAMGMVVDFGDIKDLVKTWIDTNLDHKMILCAQDPMVEVMQTAGEPYFLMEKNPTAENISALIFEQVKKLGLPVTEVRIWETPTNCGCYRQSSH